jgi:hypothetical protein
MIWKKTSARMYTALTDYGIAAVYMTSEGDWVSQAHPKGHKSTTVRTLCQTDCFLHAERELDKARRYWMDRRRHG